MSEPAHRPWGEILEDLNTVTDRIADADPTTRELDYLIPYQEALILEMNHHPDNPTNKPR